MTSLLRTASLWTARTSLMIVALSFASAGVWMLGDASSQAAQKKQRVEEEEEPAKTKPPALKKKPVEEEEDPSRNNKKRKVIAVDEDDMPAARKDKSRSSGPPPTGDLKQLAAQAKNPEIKELFRSLAEPHDVVLYKSTSGVKISGGGSQREEIILPAPLPMGKDPGRFFREKGVTFTRIRDDGSHLQYAPDLRKLESVTPYEEIAQRLVRRFLQQGNKPGTEDKPGAPSRLDRLIAAEQALSAVLLWHESAKHTGQRKGSEWEGVESLLRKQLLDEVLLEQMRLFAQDKDWDRVLGLTRRLALTYTHSSERERILAPVAEMIQKALKDPIGDETAKQKARKRLRDLEMEFPDNPAFKPLGDALRNQAQGLLDQAKELAREKKMADALDKVRKARETWPQLPGLLAFEHELGTEHPILHVGVRGQLPKYLSPSWACTDNERRAVELLFESLVQLTPDEAGGYSYRPGLAERRPKVVALGRRFELPRNAEWSDGQRLNSADVDYTLTLLRQGIGTGRSRVWGELLAAAEHKKDPFQVTLRLKQGFLDPLALMTFKILPRDRRVDEQDFATKPISSGPFRFDPSRQSDEDQRQCLFFMANPSYSLRPTRHSAPRIQEIRFYPYSTHTVKKALADLSDGKLDLLLDLTAQEAQELRQKKSAKPLPIEIPAPSVSNRRIYFLAINTARFADAKVRRALAFAINREAILDKDFRGEQKVPLHKVLNGPFPAGSWACNPAVRNRQNKKNSLDLFDADRAKTMSQDPAVVQVAQAGPYKLKYADEGNPALDEAMKTLSEQVKALTGIVLEPTACDPYRLREEVEQTHSYEVAYYHYDYPDESYWLAPLLGPPPGTRSDGKSNLFKYDNADLTTLLARTRDYRDFAMVRKYQWAAHQMLVDEMPFVPLWQLDPLLAYRRAVQPSALDPLLVFNNVAEWRLQRK